MSIYSSYSKHLADTNPERFSKDLINTKANDNVLDYIDAICKSLEIIPGITYLGSEYLVNKKFYVPSIDTKKEVDITNSILDTIRFSFKLEAPTQDGVECEYITKDLYFPRLLENQFFIIDGNRYIPIFQMVDAGTYLNDNCLTLKTLLMPIKVRNKVTSIEDMDGNTYTGMNFEIDMFKNKINVFMYYFCKFGIDEALEYFNMDAEISSTKVEYEGMDIVNFQIAKNIYVGVTKEYLEECDEHVDLVITLCNCLNNRCKIDSQEFWLRRLGAHFTKNTVQQEEKAKGILLSLERILDEITKKVLRTDDANKKDVYSVIKWMIMNYRLLSKQDTLDLDNKRLRVYEYILNPLLLRFSKSTYRLLNSKITVHNLKTIFSNIHKGTLVKEIVRNELVRYKNTVNTYDLFSCFLKITQSGKLACHLA